MSQSIILVSGWGHPAGSLDALASGLKGESPVSTVDLPTLRDAGHGLPGDAAPPISVYARGLLGRLGDASLLVGWSMGGMVALEAAAAVPERIRALVLVSTTPRFCAGGGFRHGFAEESLLTLRADLMEDPVAALDRFDALCSGTESPGTGERSPGPTRDREALLHGIDYLRTMDLLGLCPGLAIPTLVLHGRRDAVIPWRAGKWLAESLPGAEFDLLPDAAHDLPLRFPETLAERIRKFAPRPEPPTRTPS